MIDKDIIYSVYFKENVFFIKEGDYETKNVVDKQNFYRINLRDDCRIDSASDER